MASDSYVLSNLWDGINNGARWSVGVVFNRSKGLPIDKYSVFDALSSAELYATTSANAYPGQNVTVVDDKTSSIVNYKIGIDTKLIPLETFIKNYDENGNQLTGYGNLSVIKLTDAEYNELIYTGEIYKLSNAIFVVSSDIIDAHQMQIRNMADGTALDDAVTLKQLNDVSSSSHSDFTSALTAAIDSMNVSTITLTSNGNPVSVITSIDEVSGKVSITGAPLTESMVSNLVTDLGTLSNQISTKVFIKNYDDNDNPVSCYDNLSVIKLPDSDYEELVLKDELSGLSNVIFVLSSDFVNAYGMKIKNLADGTNPDDAVTLRQLNAISSGSHRDFTSALTSTVDSLSINQITLSSSNSSISVITAVDEISGKISISASSLTQSMVQNLTTDLGNISNEVSTKVYVQNQMLSDYVGTLSILQIPRDEFYALLPDGVQPNALYLVSSDTINAYGQRIENLGNAVHDTDAINKGQAIEIIENAFTNMSRDWVCGQISATLGDYEDLENVDWEHITIETVIDMVKFIYSKMGAGKVQY